MVSKSQKKLIHSLQQKKYRKQYGLFVVEGKKGINELLVSGIRLYAVYTTAPIFLIDNPEKIIEITTQELKQISSLTTPQVALALFHIPELTDVETDGLILALDDVRDPGNLGTIIRLCDWFGIEDLVCSKATVDCYNSKVVQATMGSVTRVRVHYVDLVHFLEKLDPQINIFGTFMDGTLIYTQNLPERGVIIMGNEANGISPEIEKLIKKRIAIPRFGKQQEVESLNVATATAIVLNEFRRV